MPAMANTHSLNAVARQERSFSCILRLRRRYRIELNSTTSSKGFFHGDIGALPARHFTTYP
jgi:hypothetical protein